MLNLKAGSVPLFCKRNRGSAKGVLTKDLASQSGNLIQSIQKMHKKRGGVPAKCAYHKGGWGEVMDAQDISLHSPAPVIMEHSFTI